MKKLLLVEGCFIRKEKGFYILVSPCDIIFTLNEYAKEILDYLQGDYSLLEIIDIFVRKKNKSKEEVTEEITSFVEVLKRIQLLDE